MPPPYEVVLGFPLFPVRCRKANYKYPVSLRLQRQVANGFIALLDTINKDTHGHGGMPQLMTPTHTQRP
jgi:hypothetical protein